MKNKIYLILTFFTTFCMQSCLIDDSNLDSEILNEFEKVRGEESETGTGHGYYMSNCYVDITDMCALDGQCAFLVSLSGKSVGYKYFCSDRALTTNEVYERAKNLSIIVNGERIPYFTKDEMNFITVYSYKQPYLYVIAYGDNYGYGEYAEKHFTHTQNSFNEIVDILNLRRDGAGVKWTFAGSQYPYSYVILEGEQAQFARTLSDSAFALYMDNCGKKNIGTNATPKELGMSSAKFPVTIGTRSNNGRPSSRIIRKSIE